MTSPQMVTAGTSYVWNRKMGGLFGLNRSASDRSCPYEL